MKTLLRRLAVPLLTLGMIIAVAPGAQAATGGTLGLNLTARYAGGGTGPLLGALVTAENIDTALVYPVAAYGDPATSAYYQATSLPFGSYRLRIERVGFATTYWPHQYSRETAAAVRFGSAPGCNPADAAICDLHILTAQVDQTVTVSGTVRQRSGLPQGGAIVTATRTSEPTFHPAATSGADGAYALQLPIGAYELSTPMGNSTRREPVAVTGPTSRDLVLLSPPGAPRDVVVATSSGRASVSWTPPADDGGSQISSYRVTASPGGGTCSTTATSCSFSGLANGTIYTFDISATNDVGTGVPSLVEALVQGSVPAPVRDVRVSAADRALEVTWSASASEDVREYVATASPGDRSCSTAGLACTIPGLRNGREYRITVIARSATADSAPTTAPRAISPMGLPGAPRDVRVSPSAGAMAVHWRKPLDDGGRRITQYVATAWPGGRTCQTDGARHCDISGLRTGTAYSITVRAANRAGVGTLSPGSAPTEVLPGAAAPAKIKGLRVRRTASAVLVSWHPSPRARAYWVRLQRRGSAPGTWSVVHRTRASFATPSGQVAIQIRPVGRSGPGPITSKVVG